MKAARQDSNYFLLITFHAGYSRAEPIKQTSPKINAQNGKTFNIITLPYKLFLSAYHSLPDGEIPTQSAIKNAFSYQFTY